MKRALAPALIGLGAVLIFWNLGRPMLWQDEAETALRGITILKTGLPRMMLNGDLVTTQYSLAPHEGNAAGVWIWNTWLQAYLAAASLSVFGRTPWAARLPFALASVLTLGLSWRLFEQSRQREGGADWSAHAGLALLALCPAFILFARQSRYYALTALGTVLVLWSWKRLLEGRQWADFGLAFALQFLLHSSAAYFAAAVTAIAADAFLRGDECQRNSRYWRAAAFTAVLAAPAVFYFRLWERSGNHAYPIGESLEFVKTFLLWLGVFAAPAFLPAAAALRRRAWLGVLGGGFIYCGLAGEGVFSRVAAGAAFAAIAARAATLRASRGELNLRRMSWLWLAAVLGVLSLSAAEPYGRYMMGVLPPLAYLGGRWLAEIAEGRARGVAALVMMAVATNVLGWLPLRVAAYCFGPGAPAQSVSGMMRQRLRDVKLRSDLWRISAELARGPEGYLEPVVAAIKSRGGTSACADADALSLMFAAGTRPVYTGELPARKPDWILPSPWLRLDLAAQARMASLIESGAYQSVAVEAPRLLWQNNPDPLFRDFSPKSGALPLWLRPLDTE